MYAEETVGFCLKFKGFTSSSHHAANLAAVLSTLRTLSFCSFCCENLLCTLPFSQAALSQRGTERGTSHRQDGAQPITSFAAFCMRQCASMCVNVHGGNASWIRYSQQSKQMAALCSRLLQSGSKCSSFTNRTSKKARTACEPRNGESECQTAMRQQVVSEKKLESAWLRTVAGC